jgi:hypothetical protein
MTVPRLLIVTESGALAESSLPRDNLSMDPVVIALAQLVRDRWTNEQRTRDARRSNLVVVPSEPA